MESGIFLTGGAFPELILGPGGRSPLDLVFNDPGRLQGFVVNVIRCVARVHVSVKRHGTDSIILDDSPLVKVSSALTG